MWTPSLPLVFAVGTVLGASTLHTLSVGSLEAVAIELCADSDIIAQGRLTDKPRIDLCVAEDVRLLLAPPWGDLETHIMNN